MLSLDRHSCFFPFMVFSEVLSDSTHYKNSMPLIFSVYSGALLKMMITRAMFYFSSSGSTCNLALCILANIFSTGFLISQNYNNVNTSV